MVEQHGGAQNGGQRVDNALACNIRRGPVHRFEHGGEAAQRVEIGAGGQPHAADDRGGEIAQDIAEEIRSHHHIEGLRTPHEVHGRRIHQQRFGFNAGELGRHFAKRAVPQRHAVALRVGLGDRGDALLLTALHGEIEGEAHNAFDAAAGEYRRLDGDLFGLVVVDEAAHGGVLALGVLAHDHHVDVSALASGERRGDAGIEISRPHVGVLIEGAPDGQQHAVEGSVVGDVRMADGPQENGVAGRQQIQGASGHHAAPTEEMFRAPVEILKRERHFIFPCGLLQHALGRRHDFTAHAVAGYHRDCERLHGIEDNSSASRVNGPVGRRKRLPHLEELVTPWK